MALRYHSLLFVLAAALSACNGGDMMMDSTVALCRNGETRQCTCTNGMLGIQECINSTTGAFTPCRCFMGVMDSGNAIDAGIDALDASTSP